jgi:hypothetical protein
MTPDDFDHVGFRAVHGDLSSSRGFRWPFPGQWAEAPGPIDAGNGGPCPNAVGDGLCVALDWYGAASGGIPALTCLVVRWNTGDELDPVIKTTMVCDECGAEVDRGRDEGWALVGFHPSPFGAGHDYDTPVIACSAECLLAVTDAEARLAGHPGREDAA